MKKVFAICLMMVMLVSMSVNVLAAPNGFVSSPSENPAPTVESFEPKDDDCTAHLLITPYSEKNTLPEDLKELTEKAYGEIVASDDLTKLNADLTKLAQDKNINGTDLAVSDLFITHAAGCDDHDGHVEFDIVLKADTLKHFVGLLYMNNNGEWKLASDAEVVNNGEHLKFSADSLSLYAIIVDASAEGSAPQTGDNSMIYVYVIVMLISALAVVAIAVKSRKQKV